MTQVKNVLETVEDYRVNVINRENAHYELALRLKRKERILGVPVVVLAAAVGTAIFATLQKDSAEFWRIITGLVSFLAAVLAALQTFFNYGSNAQRHETAAIGYARLRRHMDQFLLKYQDGTASRQEELAGMDGLVQQMDHLEEVAPRIPNSVWHWARYERGQPKKKLFKRSSSTALSPVVSDSAEIVKSGLSR